MSYLWNAIAKGVIEGFTEFLPISSTGHLILVDRYLPLAPGGAAANKNLNDAFDLVIQFPAILAVVLLYRQRLWGAARGALSGARERSFLAGLLLAFLPIAVAGLSIKAQAESLRSPMVVAAALLVGGVVLLLFERWVAEPSVRTAENTPLSTAVSIGVFQCLALIPGTSRSGAAIVGGRLLGLSRTAAAEYSFFLALPTMGAACVYKLLKDGHLIDWRQHGMLFAAGGVASFLTAWAVVALFMKALDSRYGLAAWGWYRIVLAVVVLTMG